MNILVLIVVIVVLPLLVAALLYLIPLLDKQIHTFSKQVAEDLGMDYLASQNSAIIKPLVNDLELLADYDGQLSNVIRGKVDDAIIFTFPFVHPSQGVVQTVLIYSERFQLPKFHLSAKAIGEFGHPSHLRLKAHSNFSKRYFVKGENEPRIRDFFSPQVLDFCSEHHPKVNLQTSLSTMLFYYQGHYSTNPNKLKELITSTQSLCRLLRESAGLD